MSQYTPFVNKAKNFIFFYIYLLTNKAFCFTMQNIKRNTLQGKLKSKKINQKTLQKRLTNKAKRFIIRPSKQARRLVNTKKSKNH